MKESYLHWLWANKVFSSRFFTTIQKEIIEILNFGNHNENEQGPDFQFGSIRSQGCDLHGHIEMHVRSSDWLLHGHEGDFQYKNVILHVVWEHDLPVDHSLCRIPTIELSKSSLLSQLEENPLVNYKLACSGLHSRIRFQWSIDYQMKYIVTGFKKKAKVYDWEKRQDQMQVLYEMIGAAFGSKINQHPFVRLCQEAPLILIKGLPVDQIQLILLRKSGLLEGAKQSYFKSKGLLPNGHPRKRILQFSTFIAQLDFEFLMEANMESSQQYLNKQKVVSKELASRILFDAILSFRMIQWRLKFENRLSENQEMRLSEQKYVQQNRFTRALKKQDILIGNWREYLFWKYKYQQDCSHLQCSRCPVYHHERQVNEDLFQYS